MNPLASAHVGRLPSLPIEVPSLDGVNIDRRALRPIFPGLTGESAIIRYRNLHSHESTRLFRRYFLQAKKINGLPGYVLKYVWNTKRRDTDQVVGTIVGDDLAAARVLIGNHVARCSMTGVRWELCEDREGEDALGIGRFDAWSLLQNVSANDLERLQQKGLTPHFEDWDFDRVFLNKACTGCGQDLSVNWLAFNIDSARCDQCGVRPHLSGLIHELLRLTAPEVTRKGMVLLSPTNLVTNVVAYLGHLDVSLDDLADDPSSEQPNARKLFTELYALSDQARLALGHTAGTELVHADPLALKTAQAAAAYIKRGVADGAFSEVHQKAAEFMGAVLRKRAKPHISA